MYLNNPHSTINHTFKDVFNGKSFKHSHSNILAHLSIYTIGGKIPLF